MKIPISFKIYKQELETFDKAVAVRQPSNLRIFATEYAATRGVPLVILFKHLGNLIELEEYENAYQCKVVD